MRDKQIDLENKIDKETIKIISKFNNKQIPRYLFININDQSALELLRSLTLSLLTRPQMEQMLIAIKTAKPNKKYLPGANLMVKFSARYFSIQVLK